jgi:hypothetical protein
LPVQVAIRPARLATKLALETAEHVSEIDAAMIMDYKLDIMMTLAFKNQHTVQKREQYSLRWTDRPKGFGNRLLCFSHGL